MKGDTPMDDLLNTLQTILGGSAGRATKAKDICAAIRQAGNYRWVGLYDVTETEVRNIAWSGPGAPAYPNFPLTRGLSSVAIADKKIVVSNDVASDPRYHRVLKHGIGNHRPDYATGHGQSDRNARCGERPCKC